MGDGTSLDVWVPCIWPIQGRYKSQSSYNILQVCSQEDALQVGDLVMMRGCCADDGTFLDVWVPSIWPNVERIAVYGAESTFDRRQRGLNATAGSATDTLSDPPSD